MPDYDLTGLSSRSFEKMIQALAVTALGTAVSVFGDGPDGGREATFEGHVRVDAQNPWSGYGVVQAKFRQRPLGSKQDADWLIKELTAELAKYSKPTSRRRKPEYYLIATNVVLTPVNESGGKDRVIRVLQEAAKSHGWKGFHIWDADQLEAMLNGNEGVRRAFAAFITSGDVLSEVAQRLAISTPDFAETLANFLAKEILSSQYANLEQAGYTGEERIPLSRVFVDLPYSSRWSPNDSESPQFLSDLIEIACDRLDPESRGAPTVGGKADPNGGRYVLIGGPGQGKTTLGQFACQIFRAGILSSRPTKSLSAEVQVVVQSVIAACEVENLSPSRVRRFPLHVTLSELAASLAAEKGVSSLLEFVAGKISKRTGHSIELYDLRIWLSKYPWMLLLDGLDEVPSSANRADLLRVIEEFWIDLTQLNADVLVLATTRPQGYTDEFSSRYYQHYRLVPLSAPRAQHYASRLVAARFRTDEDRAARLLGRLAEAASLEATAKLMRSPLQITIMSTLLDQVGRAPQDRWRLFHEYYQAIYRREMERDTPAAALLSQYRTDIDVIHARVGLELQLEAERSGGTEARLTKATFLEVVRARVEEKGYSGDAAASLAASIQDAAETRLVFLVSPTAETVGFEIRSLQEFMCAQALMSGATTDIQLRLRAIAGLPTWHNVFIFAAGRCFAIDEHLIDTVYSICAELNVAYGELDRLIRAGSVLAVDLLEDGVADRQPRLASLLVELALDLIDAPPSADLLRLAARHRPDVDALFRARIVQALNSAVSRLSGWSVLLALVNRGIEWADSLAALEWPESEHEQNSIFQLTVPDKGTLWLTPRAATLVSKSGIDSIWKVHEVVVRARDRATHIPEWLASLSQVIFLERDHGLKVEASIGQSRVGTLSVVPLIGREFWATLRYCDSGHESFALLRAAANFAVDPSRPALAAVLRLAAATENLQESWILALPWPASACFEWAESAEELDTLARSVESGKLGDFGDWQRAEEHWLAEGVVIAEEPSETDLPFVGANPSPLFAASFTSPEEGAPDALLSLYPTLSPTKYRRLIASWIASYVYERAHAPQKERPALSLHTVRLMCDDLASPSDFILAEFLLAVEAGELFSDEWLELANIMGMCRGAWIYDQQLSAAQVLFDAVIAKPSHFGLLHLLVRSLQSNRHAASVNILTRTNLEKIHPRQFQSPLAVHDSLVLWALLDQINQGDVVEFAAFASDPKQQSNQTAFVLANVVGQRVSDATVGEMLLLALYPAFAEEERIEGVTDLLSAVRAKRRSNVKENWTTFGLPPMRASTV